MATVVSRMMLNLPEFGMRDGTMTETELTRQAGCLKKDLETSRGSRVFPGSTNASFRFDLRIKTLYHLGHRIFKNQVRKKTTL